MKQPSFNKLVLTVLALALCGGAFAQSNVDSPYSMFGLGQVRDKTMNTRLKGMGGVANAMWDKSMVNPGNPASYAMIDTLSFLFDAGIYAKSSTDIFEVEHTSYTIGEAIPAGISYGWERMVGYVSSLKILFTKDGTKNLGGFLAIGSLFPQTWDWYAFWSLTALLGLILAFMNIIPIPGLDGGHIVITLYEMITRRKASEKALDIIQKIGMFLLLALLVIANGNDLIHLFNGWF